MAGAREALASLLGSTSRTMIIYGAGVPCGNPMRKSAGRTEDFSRL